MIIKQIKRFRNAFTGIFFALKTDSNYLLQFFGIGGIIIIFVCIMQPLSQTEVLFLGLAWVLILITELQNSAFENALDKLHPEKNEHIGNSKDMAAGSVLLSGFFLIFVMGIVVLL